ncbi:MAG: hypothetical protein GY793_12350 [Proteobacteria bacterium]|nr:hypothetical protein [Pseudomonadota bacterium]
MNNIFYYFFLLALVALGIGFFLFGSGYDFEQYRLKGEKSLQKKKPLLQSEFIFPMKFETQLKDSRLKMDIRVALHNRKGLKEIKRKLKRVKFGVTLVLSKYRKAQLNRRKLERSTLKKLIQSQLKNKVIKVQIVNFEI